MNRFAYSESMAGFFKRSYSGLAQLGTFFGHLLLLIVRLYWGGSLFMVGLGKFANLEKVAAFFDTLHLPFPMATAIFVALVELIGGASLFLGLFSRVMSFLLIILFWTAYILAHTEALLNLFTNPSGFFMQDPFLYLYAATMVFCFGAGFASFDYWLEKKR